MTIGSLTASIGLQKLRNEFAQFPVSQVMGKQINDACNKIGISNSPLDYNFYSTSWDNYQIIASKIYDIVKNFKWEEDRYDCDNRSNTMSSLTSLTARLNTNAGLYCEVKTANGNTFMHWANCVIDKDANMYIIDCDNSGVMQKITSNKFTIGNWSYSLKSIRIG